ncbi:MAG TPA: sigma factor-like helix-turn-helix DNA-binding protein, partial [Pirellulales bacterium]
SEDRRRRREQVVGSKHEDDAAQRLDDQLDAEVAARALEKLPPDEREIVVARVWGGLSFAEIAELANSSASTVFRRYEAGLTALRVLLRAPCPPNE